MRRKFEAGHEEALDIEAAANEAAMRVRKGLFESAAKYEKRQDKAHAEIINRYR